MSDQKTFDTFVREVKKHINTDGDLTSRPIEMAGPGIRLTLTSGNRSSFVDVSLLRIERNESDFAPHVAHALVSKLAYSKL